MMLLYLISHLTRLNRDLQVCSVAHGNTLQQLRSENTAVVICYPTAEYLESLCYRSRAQLGAVNAMLASTHKHVVTGFQGRN